MKRFYFLLILGSFSFITSAQTLMNFHDFEVVTIEGDTISLSQYAGKKLLVVNTASYCGYTHQFNDLQALYQQYGGSNFEILGFPCNDFGSQDPGADSTILEFCTSNYNVTFQMMSRIHIKTGDTASVYKWLQRGELNGVADAAVTWNFNKFLIDAQGNWSGYYDSPILPNNPAIVDWILAGSEPLGISESKQTSFRVWSFENSIHVSNPVEIKNPIQLQLYSISGKLLNHEILSFNSNPEYQYSVGGISPGMYILKLQSGDQIENHRIVISNQ